MKIRLNVSRAGAGFAQSRGEIVDVPDGEAARMIAAGQAEAVADDPRSPAAERATGKRAGVERAVKR